ncbi:hypothetical protein BGZ54_002130 [Gamsiella multidivaricata]|nr:hypothetical protein BGZ54_002130 [Gamsiella multidivaricata]
MLISATCDILTIQAFELLLAHEPSLIGTSVSGGKDAQASRGNGLAGESLLTTALAISRDIGLDKSLQALHDLLAGPKEKIADGQLSNLFNAASLWISLRLWEGHYIHMKAAIRPIRHFDELAKIAKCMIAIDENGDKVEGTPANLEGFVAGTIESPAQDTEKMIRSAGRTILAYRMQSMAVYQESLAEVQEMITATGDQEHEQAASRAKDKIVEIILGALDMQFYIEQIKQVDMAPYAWHPSASLVEEWSRLESSALFSILCTFGTATLYTGQFDGAFSIKGFVNALRSDEDLRRRISAVGSKRMELSEGLLSSFVFFNRRLTLGAAAAMTTTSNRNPKGLMEVTGAPLLLTSALVVDACRLFLEGAAFVLITYFIIDYKGDIRLSLMVQAAQRLDEFDGNIYLSPARSNPKSRNSRDVSHEEQDDEGGQPLSICRVAAKYTQEIVEAMQRWKLASSVYRRPSSVPAFVPERKLRNEWRRQTKETMSDGEEDSTQRASPTAPVVAAPSVAQPTLTHGLASDCVRDRTAQGSFAMNVDGMSAAQRGRGNITNGSHGGVVFANAAGPWTNIQPLTTEMPFPGHGQAPLSFPFQSWPQDPMSGREHMSVEQLLSGSFPYATQHGTGDFVGGFNDLPLFDSFLDTLFPPH